MDQKSEICEQPGPGRPRLFDEATALEAALRVFWEKGYRATTLDDLTSAMGLSRSGLYGCYGSKHDIFVAAFKFYNDASLAVLVTQMREATSPRDTVRRVFDAMANVGGERNGCFFANCVTEITPHDPEIEALGRCHLARVEGLLASAYRSGGARGMPRTKPEQ